MDHGKMEALAKNYGEDLASRFERFFRTYYSREIHKLVQGYPAERSLWVDFRVLDRYDISLADELISNPDSTIAAAKKALQNTFEDEWSANESIRGADELHGVDNWPTR